jgi:hypothetical protein
MTDATLLKRLKMIGIDCKTNRSCAMRRPSTEYKGPGLSNAPGIFVSKRFKKCSYLIGAIVKRDKVQVRRTLLHVVANIYGITLSAPICKDKEHNLLTDCGKPSNFASSYNPE